MNPHGLIDQLSLSIRMDVAIPTKGGPRYLDWGSLGRPIQIASKSEANRQRTDT
jgi:hypothetical protein